MILNLHPLYPGMADDRVPLLKQLLNEILKLNPPLTVNNKFDKDAKNALMQFEKKRHIYTADGRVDSVTWVAFARALPPGRLQQLVGGNAELAKLFGLIPNSSVVEFNDYPPFDADDLKIVKKGIELGKKMVGDAGSEKDKVLAVAPYNIPSILTLLNGVKAEGADANTFDGRESVYFTVEKTGKSLTTKMVRQYFIDNKQSVGAIVIFGGGRAGKNVMFIGDYYFSPFDVENLDRQRAFIIMHESVHLVGNKHDTDFGQPPSVGSKNLSRLLVEKIFPAALKNLGGVA